MTYFGFLFRFLIIPILLLAALVWAGRQRLSLRGLPFATGVHIILALLYTTPWDNYLVATGVWYYNPALISGFLLGYVPLEEYIFFVLQTILVGLWWGLLALRLAPTGGFQPSARLRKVVSLAVGLLWLISAVVFLSGWKPGTYPSITLFWALPPILLQLIFGADILWHFRRLLAAVILPIGVYLSWADSLAITATTWAIHPAQSLGIFLGRLPLEEGIFF
ncbi:MAG TPA: lycopene cyclase domain-containing protein, partial [Anaerolineales bacterium]